MMQIVMSEAELDALPDKVTLLNTDGVLLSHTRGVKYSWARQRAVPLTSAQVADGCPILVLWNPEAPEVLLSSWLEAMAEAAPHKLAASGLELVNEILPQPGAEVLTETLLRGADRDPELDGLAVLDFLNCWSKKVARS